jgi:hypothetical protein
MVTVDISFQYINRVPPISGVKIRWQTTWQHQVKNIPPDNSDDNWDNYQMATQMTTQITKLIPDDNKDVDTWFRLFI